MIEFIQINTIVTFLMKDILHIILVSGNCTEVWRNNSSMHIWSSNSRCLFSKHVSCFMGCHGPPDNLKPYHHARRHFLPSMFPSLPPQPPPSRFHPPFSTKPLHLHLQPPSPSHYRRHRPPQPHILRHGRAAPQHAVPRRHALKARVFLRVLMEDGCACSFKRHR